MRHFTLKQFADSTTAKNKGIDNNVPENLKSHAVELVENILDPLVDAWGSNVIMTSGYRCLELNVAIGGSKTSAHSYAWAADLVPANGKVEEFKEFTMKWLLNNNIQFDQYINEYNGSKSWVHIGIKNSSGAQRKQYMLYKNQKYTSINPNFYKNETLSTSNQVASVKTGGGNTQTGNTSDILIGKNIYYKDLDLDQIKNNGIYLKDESGNPILDSNGKPTTSDEYLFGANELKSDIIIDINEFEAEPLPDFDTILASIDLGEAEYVKGISYKADGSYVANQSKTIREIIVMYEQWWKMVENFKNLDWKNLYKQTKVDKDYEPDGTLTINAMEYMKAAFDMYGHAYRTGMTCPICGKKARFLPPGGYCSLKCLLIDLKNKSLAFLMSPNDKYKWLIDLINELCALLDQTNLLINAIVYIPDIIKELSALPDKYKKYIQNKIAEGFAILQEQIQIAMTYKNELLQKLLKPINFGIIAKPIAMAMQAIEVVNSALEVAQEAFELAYDSVKLILDKLTTVATAPPGLKLPAESFAWGLTPRSFLSPMPYQIGGDAGKIFVVLPGGSGVPLESAKALLPSAIQDINFEAIDATIQGIFPPLTPMDYYLEPELFEIRFLFSDQSDLVTQVRQQLEDYLKGGPDYLPAFENMLPIKTYTFAGVDIPLPNVGYLWFLMGLLDAWAPHSQALVGSIIHPEA